MKIQSKRFWWFHKLFKTKTYKAAKALEGLLNSQEFQFFNALNELSHSLLLSCVSLDGEEKNDGVEGRKVLMH